MIKEITKMTVTLLLSGMLLLTLTNVNNAEMIQIQNKTHILCATHAQNSPFYLDPPLNLDAVNPCPLQLHGWNSIHSVETFHKAIIDKRWEGLETFTSTYLPFDLKKSLTLSVYSLETNELEFFIDDDKEYMDYISLNLEEGQWIHYSFVVKDGNVYFYKNDNLEQTLTNFFPTRLFAKTKMDAFWKIHNYTWLYSDSISNQPAQLTDPPSREDGCSIFYVSLCSTCVLDISGPNVDRYTFRNTDNVTWHSREVHMGFGQKTVNILKRNVDESIESYWELDVRACPLVKDGRAIYEKSLENVGNRHCFSLNRNEKYKRTKRMTEDRNLLSSSCKPGELGKNCDVKCEHLLGNERKYCERHKICENDNCACAWGYEGQDCNKQCSDGKWGLSCKNSCSKECVSCDKHTGECLKMKAASAITSNGTASVEENNITATAFVLLLVLSITIILGIIIILKMVTSVCDYSRMTARPLTSEENILH